jgi:hypothetical protein
VFLKNMMKSSSNIVCQADDEVIASEFAINAQHSIMGPLILVSLHPSQKYF